MFRGFCVVRRDAMFEAAIAPLPEVQDVSDDLQMTSPRVNLVINRDEAAALGLSASDIETALYAASARS